MNAAAYSLPATPRRSAAWCGADPDVCSAPFQASRTLSGYTVSVKALGDGYLPGRPNVFLVHGMADASTSWHPVLRRLTGHVNLWGFDLPWSGQDGADWPVAMTAEAWWDAALELCPARADFVVGHSFGACMLLDWLARSPGQAARLKGMVLLAPFYRQAGIDCDWSALNAYADRLPSLLEMGLRVRYTGTPPSPTVLAAMAEKVRSRVVPTGLIEFFRLFMRSMYWQLSHLNCPVEIVCGERDEAINRSSAAALAKALPNARLHTLDECGHYCVQEQTARVQALLTRLMGAWPCA